MNSYLISRGLKSIWISERTDGRTGTGTATDPLNGGTPDRFDALMRKVPPGYEINILGHHFTRGWREGLDGSTAGNYWSPNAGRIAGHAGAELELVEAITPKTKHFVIGGTERIERLEVCGLTLNAGADKSSAVHSVFGGVAVHVEHLNVHDCRLVNTGTFGPTDLECFVIFADASKSLRIERNHISDPHADTASNNWMGIGAGGEGSGWITDNLIVGKQSVKSSAIGVTNCDGWVIAGNHVFDCDKGFYNDSYSSGAVDILDNQFIRCITGVHLEYKANDGASGLFRVFRNRIVMREGVSHATAASFIGHATRPEPSFDTIVLRENHISRKTAPTPVGNGIVQVTNARYFEALGNHFDCDGPYFFTEKVGVIVTANDVWANYNRNGEIV